MINPTRIELLSRGLRLIGDLYYAGDTSLVVLCHGFTSNRHSRGRFPLVAQALVEQGISSLALDFAGCGESDDTILTLEGQVTDALAALSWAGQQGFQRLGVYGHSLGGLVALLVASHARLQALVVSGAATGPMHYDWQALYGTEAVEHLEHEGVLVLPSERPGGTVVVGQSLLNAFAKIDQHTLLSSLLCPVLLVDGDDEQDSEEQQLLAHSRRGLSLLPEGSHLSVIHGAPHSFQNHVEELVEAVVNWLVEHL